MLRHEGARSYLGSMSTTVGAALRGRPGSTLCFRAGAATEAAPTIVAKLRLSTSYNAAVWQGHDNCNHFIIGVSFEAHRSADGLRKKFIRSRLGDKLDTLAPGI